MLGQAVAIAGLDGPTTEPGVTGVVLIAGPNMVRGYHNQPDHTASTITENWLHTGDIDHLDADGYLTIIERIEDIIIRGGENIYPKEIEKTVATHPHVLEYAVVGRKTASRAKSRRLRSHPPRQWRQQKSTTS